MRRATLHSAAFAAASLLVAACAGPDRKEARGEPAPAAQRTQAQAGVDPALAPAFEAIERAFAAGDDAEARGILARIRLRRPRGRALLVIRAYERILAGRELVGALDLRLVSRLEPASSAEPGIPLGSRVARLYLTAQRAQPGEKGPLELWPGPATLIVTRSIVDRAGLEQDAVETHTFGDLGTLRMEAGKAAELSLARFFLSVPDGALAARLRFDVELRSGTLRVPVEGGAGRSSGEKTARELPAMRLRATGAEETVLEPSLAELPASGAEELAALLSGVEPVDPLRALSVAVRIPAGERGRTLDLLAPVVEGIPESSVVALVPALRWIALTAEPGGDARAWRAWLRAREERKAGERPRLILPRAGSTP